MEEEKPLLPILRKRLQPGWSSADLWERLDALFEHYGLSRERQRSSPQPTFDDWPFLVWYLAIDYIPGFQEARPVGRPRKHDFTDDDARIFYELGKAEFERWLDKKRPTVNVRARIVAKMLDEEKTSVQVKNRYHTLYKRSNPDYSPAG